VSGSGGSHMLLLEMFVENWRIGGGLYIDGNPSEEAGAYRQ
jgi:hypothetical protein